MPFSTRNSNSSTLGWTAAAATLLAVVTVALAPTLQTLAGRLHLRLLLLQSSRRRKQEQLEAENKSEADNSGITVTALYTYPVKSLRATAHAAVQVGARGLRHDRRCMLAAPIPASATSAALLLEGDDSKAAAATHRFLSQRQCPSLTQIEVRIVEEDDGATIMTLYHKDDAAQQNRCVVPLPKEDAAKHDDDSSSSYYSCTLWGDVVRVKDLGDAAAEFLRSAVAHDSELGEWEKERLRLVVQCDDDHPRAADPMVVPAAARSVWTQRGPAVSLADGFPLLIASESSLADLNARLQAAGQEPVPMARFRPNLVLRGTAPFVEDNFKVLQVGDDGVILHVVSSCPRCKQSCTDQESGAVTDEPVATLRSFRQVAKLPENNNDNVYFAINAVPAPGSVGKTIQLGDPVRVLQTGVPVWSEG